MKKRSSCSLNQNRKIPFHGEPIQVAMKKLIILAFSAVLILGFGSAYGHVKQDQKPKVITKNNVPPENADKETASIIISLGFSYPAIGNDPCQGAQKPMGGMKKYSSINISLGKLPGKPSVSVGKSGQAMEGEEVYPGVEEQGQENVCIESYDSEGNVCVRATTEEQTGKTTYENLSDNSCDVQIGKDEVLHMAPKSQVSLDPSKEKTTGEKILEGVGKVWKETQDFFGVESKPSRPTRTSVAGDRGNCDPYGITGGCRVDKGSAWVIPPWLNPMDKLREAESKGWVEKLKSQRVNPNPESAIPSGGPTPAKTYPGESIKSGYEKEKESRIDKGGLVTNPTGEGGGFSGRGFDLCGRHLPSPEEFTKMKLDPGHIVDPVDRTWTGRIEQVEQERSLVWSKSVINSDGSSVRVERRYTNGSLSSIIYTFYDKNGKQIGSVNYNAQNRSVTGEKE